MTKTLNEKILNELSCIRRRIWRRTIERTIKWKHIYTDLNYISTLLVWSSGCRVKRENLTENDVIKSFNYFGVYDWTIKCGKGWKAAKTSTAATRRATIKHGKEAMRSHPECRSLHLITGRASRHTHAVTRRISNSHHARALFSVARHSFHNFYFLFLFLVAQEVFMCGTNCLEWKLLKLNEEMARRQCPIANFLSSSPGFPCIHFVLI